jgi:hypothetical protein
MSDHQLANFCRVLYFVLTDAEASEDRNTCKLLTIKLQCMRYVPYFVILWVCVRYIIVVRKVLDTDG